MKKNGKNSHPLRVRLAADDLRKLKVLALKQDTSISKLLGRLAKEYLDNQLIAAR